MVIRADDETIDMTGRAKHMQATLVHSLLLWLGQWVSNLYSKCCVYISSLLASFSGVI